MWGAIEPMLAQWAHLRSPLAALTYLCVLAPSLALAMLAFSSAMLSSASFGLTAGKSQLLNVRKTLVLAGIPLPKLMRHYANQRH